MNSWLSTFIVPPISLFTVLTIRLTVAITFLFRAIVLKPLREKDTELRQALYDCFSMCKTFSQAAKDCGAGTTTIYKYRKS
jgi:hypothetical protein